MITFPSTPRGDRLQAIAVELIDVLKERFEYTGRLAVANENMAAARLALLPATGWPGPNETARKAAQQLAEDSDPDFLNAQLSAREAQVALGELNLRLECLAAERRAHEQSIYDEELVQDLRGRPG